MHGGESCMDEHGSCTGVSGLKASISGLAAAQAFEPSWGFRGAERVQASFLPGGKENKKRTKENKREQKEGNQDNWLVLRSARAC